MRIWLQIWNSDSFKFVFRISFNFLTYTINVLNFLKHLNAVPNQKNAFSHSNAKKASNWTKLASKFSQLIEIDFEPISPLAACSNWQHQRLLLKE